MFQLIIKMDVPEWLSGMTRNHVGFACTGLNHAVHAFENVFFLETTTIFNYFSYVSLLITVR